MNQDTLIEYRVWPDGTVQAVADGQAYAWMSDDFRVVQASSPEQALLLANEGGFDAVQVSPDGRTVWVHAPDGSTVGRFSTVFGMDVHTSVTAQLAGAEQCLHCTHTKPGLEHWNQFCDLIQANYAIVVDRSLIVL